MIPTPLPLSKTPPFIKTPMSASQGVRFAAANNNSGLYNLTFEAVQQGINNMYHMELFCHVLGSDLNWIAPTSSLPGAKAKMLELSSQLNGLNSLEVAARLFKTLSDEASLQGRVKLLKSSINFPIDDNTAMSDAIRKITDSKQYAPQYMQRFPQDVGNTILKLMIYAKANRREAELTQKVLEVLGQKPLLIRLLQAFERPLVNLNPSAIQ